MVSVMVIYADKAPVKVLRQHMEGLIVIIALLNFFKPRRCSH